MAWSGCMSTSKGLYCDIHRPNSVKKRNRRSAVRKSNSIRKGHYPIMSSNASVSKAPSFWTQIVKATAPPVAQASTHIMGPVASSLAGGGTTKPQNPPKIPAPKARPATQQPTSGEVSLPARYPLIAALQSISGPEVVSSASNLMLVTTTFPKS